MPDVEEKTVDIDTTGPGAEVNIEEEKKEETVEPVVEEKKKQLKRSRNQATSSRKPK